jgi:peptidoglycan/xylan/chitin deacetylase (PgdA/CDA1 family)
VPAPRPYGLMFHHFRGVDPPAGQGALTAGEFSHLIDRIGRARILPADVWLERALAGRLGPDDLCLTFDDNLRSQFEIARPVLQARQLTAFFFVQSAALRGEVERLALYSAFQMRAFDHVEAFQDAFEKRVASAIPAAEFQSGLARFDPATYLAQHAFYSAGDRRYRFLRDELLGPQRYAALMDAWLAERGVNIDAWRRELWMDAVCLQTLQDEGHIIGLHSHTHPTRLAEFPADDQRREYITNQQVLTEILGAPPRVAAHPCNSYNADTLGILRELGVQLAFCSNRAVESTDPLEWPREDCANLRP